MANQRSPQEVFQLNSAPTDAVNAAHLAVNIAASMPTKWTNVSPTTFKWRNWTTCQRKTPWGWTASSTTLGGLIRAALIWKRGHGRRAGGKVDREGTGGNNNANVTADVYKPERRGQPVQKEHLQVEILNDGGDPGPAPLQNNEVEEEMYEEVVHSGVDREGTGGAATSTLLPTYTNRNAEVNLFRKSIYRSRFSTMGATLGQHH